MDLIIASASSISNQTLTSSQDSFYSQHKLESVHCRELLYAGVPTLGISELSNLLWRHLSCETSHAEAPRRSAAERMPVKVMLPISHCSIERDLTGPLSSTMHEACEVLQLHHVASFFYFGKPTNAFLFSSALYDVVQSGGGVVKNLKVSGLVNTGALCHRVA
jgi:hypothetical protein